MICVIMRPGNCLNGCNAGWIGDLCNTECPDGRFGTHCMYQCPCQNKKPCDTQTGNCTYCPDGWIGKACQQKCEVGKFGTYCNETCLKCKDMLCNHETGQCLYGCNTGWEGYLCNKNDNDFVIGGILIVSICLNIYCFLKRRERSTIVSEIPMEVHYDEIGTINGNSANVRALSNNVLEAEIIVDGPAIGRASHHLSSIELSTSSEYSVHSLSASRLSGDGYEHPYQTIDSGNIEVHPYSTVQSNVYQNSNFN